MNALLQCTSALRVPGSESVACACGGWVGSWVALGRWGRGRGAGVRRSQEDDEKARRPAARPVATITSWIGL